MITFLEAVDSIIPERIDADLIAWLKSIEQHEWTCDIIVKALGTKNKAGR